MSSNGIRLFTWDSGSTSQDMKSCSIFITMTFQLGVNVNQIQKQHFTHWRIIFFVPKTSWRSGCSFSIYVSPLRGRKKICMHNFCNRGPLLVDGPWWCFSKRGGIFLMRFRSTRTFCQPASQPKAIRQPTATRNGAMMHKNGRPGWALSLSAGKAFYDFQ